MFSRRNTIAVLAACALHAACDDDPTAPREAGTYVATEIVAVDNELGTIDFLEMGSELTITLHSDGSTTGTLFVPGGEEDGSDLDVSLAGTWTEDDDQVTFEQEADTFLRDMTFTYANGELHAEETFPDGTMTVTLTRQ